MTSKHANDPKILAEHLRARSPTIAAAVSRTTGGADAGPLLAHALGDLDRTLAALGEADDAHARALAAQHLARIAQEAAAVETSHALTGLKRAASSLFGDAVMRLLRFPREVPVHPTSVARTVAWVIGALSTKRLPRPRFPGLAPVDPTVWIALLAAPLRTLVTARRDAAHTMQNARATRDARRLAHSELARASGTATKLAEALARVGGVVHLADGLRGSFGANDAPANDVVATPAREVA